MDLLTARRLFLTIGGLCCCALALLAQTSDSTQAGPPPQQSWTATSDLKSENVSSRRVIESHTESGNRTLDKQSIQVPGPGGQYEYYEDIEKETVRLDANTVHITTRMYGRNGNGEKTLVQVTEERSYTLPGGGSTVVKTTSTPDPNGGLQLIRRDIVETKAVDTNVEETNTTVMLPSINGGFAPVEKVHELRKETGDTVDIQRSTLRPDGSGNWQITELQEHTARQKTNNRSSEQRVVRRDFEGNLGEVSRVVSQELNSDPGENHTIVQTYSIDVHGATGDGTLHLVERKTITERTSSTGARTTEEKLEQINPADPGAGLRVSVLANVQTLPGPSGEQSTVTIRGRDLNGSFGIVAVDTTKSDQVPTFQIEQTPAAQSK